MNCTVHSAGLIAGVSSLGVDTGLEIGVATAVEVVLGVRDGLKSVGVDERVSMGDGEGVTVTSLGGGGGLTRASISASFRGNSLGVHGWTAAASVRIVESSTSLGVGLSNTLFCFPLQLLPTVDARGCGLDDWAVLASGVEARL